MKKHAMPEVKEGNVNVTPLIDIVMCLIIFFMLVAKIGVSRGDDPTIEPPSTILGHPIEDIGNTLTLNVTDPRPLNENTTTDPCDRIGASIDIQPIVTAMVEKGLEPKEIKVFVRDASGNVIDTPLRRVLETAIKGDKKRGIPGNPNLKVILKAEKCLEYRLLQQVLLTCAEAGTTNINFETKKQSIMEAAEANEQAPPG